MTERWERCWNAKMQRFSFDGRSCGMTVERRVFLVPPSFLTERGRPNEDGTKKVEWFSYGISDPKKITQSNEYKNIDTNTHTNMTLCELV